MTRRYFGTDGVRGRVGEHPMTVEFALRLASAAARVLTPEGGAVLIGKDTRLSGYMFESALEAGFVAAGDLLLQLADLRKVLVRAYVDEPDIARLVAGEPIDVTWDAVPSPAWHTGVREASLRWPSSTVPLSPPSPALTSSP